MSKYLFLLAFKKIIGFNIKKPIICPNRRPITPNLNKPINIKAEMYDESNQMIDSKDYTINVVKPIVTMEQSTNKNKTYLEEGEKIEYKYVLKNF